MAIGAGGHPRCGGDRFCPTLPDFALGPTKIVRSGISAVARDKMVERFLKMALMAKMLDPLVVDVDVVLGEGVELGVIANPCRNKSTASAKCCESPSSIDQLLIVASRLPRAVALPGSSRNDLALAAAASANRFSASKSTPRL